MFRRLPFSPFSSRAALRLLALMSALILAAALFGQYVLGWHPCHLCLLQRYPYVAVIVLGVAGGFFLKRESPRRVLLILCLPLLLTGGGIAGYHAGVEAGIFAGPTSCTSEIPKTPQTLEEMRAAILNAPLVTCDQAMAHVLGISLAGWNLLLYALLVLFTLLSLSRRHAP